MLQKKINTRKVLKNKDILEKFTFLKYSVYLQLDHTASILQVL